MLPIYIFGRINYEHGVDTISHSPDLKKFAWLEKVLQSFVTPPVFLGRLPKVDLIILEGEKCPSVRPSVHKKFLRFE